MANREAVVVPGGVGDVDLIETVAAVARNGLRVVVAGDEDVRSRLEGLGLLAAVDTTTAADSAKLAEDLGLAHADACLVLDLDERAAWQSVLADETAQRQVEARHGIVLDAGWSILERGFEPEQIITTGSNYMTGNGYLGYRATFPEWGADGYVACVVTDTYDCADGKWRELVNVPNALFASWRVGRTPLRIEPDGALRPGDRYERRLDLRLGRTTRRLQRDTEHGRVDLLEERFASLDDVHVVSQLQRIHSAPGTELGVETGVDAELWQLNGEHLRSVETAREGDLLTAVGVTVEAGIEIAVVHGLTISGAKVVGDELERQDRRLLRNLVLEAGDDAVTVHQVMAVYTSRDTDDPLAAAVAAARSALEQGHHRLLAPHLAAWHRIWSRVDVRIDGDPVAQAAVRFGLYHNAIATPRHTDTLPIGARGLSCQAYQGGAFWDQETFNLPVYLFTEPEIARQLLVYRHRTLDGARRKAARLGYRGAYYAWISGRTGDELCPDFFFRDVLTGRWVRNHFNDWQMHVSPDIAVTIRHYVATTGDRGFLVSHGAEMLFEIARFLDSFVYYKHDLGRYESLRVLGPDEFHENVDNNAFTNYQIELALRTALETWDWMQEADPDALEALRQRLSITDQEVSRWRDVQRRMYLPAPDSTGVIEAFDGFGDLEDVRPSDLQERLLDPDEYWGWPNGVAVHTQVSKQADVVELFVLQPQRFDPDVMGANLDYYLPRTAHKSSLSLSAYAIVAARLGRLDAAYDLFVESATTDLFSRDNAAPGGTFIGGIRTAAAAASWLVVVAGFVGLQVDDDGVSLRPGLPAAWERLRLSAMVRGCRLHLDLDAETVSVTADEANPGPLTLQIHDRLVDLEPSEQVTVP